MPARPCLFVACAPSGSRIHPSYVKLFRKNCPAESTRTVEWPKNQGPEQLRKWSILAERRGERILRTAVQWRKISFGNRSRNGEIATARLLTVTQTCKRQQRHVLGYLTDAVRCHRRQTAAPSLLPQRP